MGKDDQGEVIPSTIPFSQRVYINYRKLNLSTRKDHFPILFLDQILKKGHRYYCFLDGYLGYFQIEIVFDDQDKTMFTCPFGTFACRWEAFGLCNASTTFPKFMLSLVQNMIDEWVKVFMDDLTTYKKTFERSLRHLKKFLKRYAKTNLMINQGKCQFMVSTGIVLGDVILEKEIER